MTCTCDLTAYCACLSGTCRCFPGNCECSRGTDALFPWISKPVRPELIKDPVTGLYPGQKDHDDIPGFLKRINCLVKQYEDRPWLPAIKHPNGDLTTPGGLLLPTDPFAIREA